MRYKVCVWLVFGIALLGAPLNIVLAIDEQLKTRVVFIPLRTAGTDQRLVVVGEKISDEIELKLGLMTDFRIRRVEDVDPFAGDAVLGDYVRENRIDNVLFGLVQIDPSGNIGIELSVFDRQRGRVVKTARGLSPSLFEVFHVTDALLSSLIVELSGMHLGFGSIDFINTGESGDFAVYIDGDRTGINLTKIAKVFNGKRRIEIRQNRMLGRETIHSADITVYDGSSDSVEFQIPYLIPEEREVIDKFEGNIAKYSRLGAREGVLESYERLIALLGNSAYCRRLEELRKRYRQREVEYRLVGNFNDIEDSFYRPRPWLFDELESISAEADSYSNPDRVHELLLRNATYLFTVLRINAGDAFSDGRWEEGVQYYNEMDRIVRAVPLDDRDWFFSEKEYVDKRWERYQRRIDRSEIMTEISIGVSMAKRLKDLIADSERVFRRYDVLDEKELIILTDPPGMALNVDGKREGQSPVRLKKIEGDTATIQIEDPWYRENGVATDLDRSRNVVFIHVKPDIHIDTLPVEVSGRRFRLAWSDLEGTRSYSIQIDLAGGDFRSPLFEKTDIRRNTYTYKGKLEPGSYYRFRVQGINQNGMRSNWSYSEAFAPE
jgi:hypothetical protein